jgi:hypothetical protein
MIHFVAMTAALILTAPAAASDDPSKAVIEGAAVDEAGAPVDGATVRVRQWLHPDVTAITAADGRFRIVLDAPLAIVRMVHVASADGSRQGRYRTEFMDLCRVVNARVVLKPAATVRVSVVDGRGAAVPGAVVAVDDLADMLAHTTTDAGGAATMRVPADARVNVVVGFKGGVGFDYFENYHTSEQDQLPVPAAVKLVLNGARTIRIRAADSADRPLAGIPFCPALVGKKGKIAFVVSTGFLYALADIGVLPRSGSDGVAVCDWFPLELKRASPFDPIAPGYHCPASPYIDQSTTTVEPARLLRMVKAGGRVTGADGAPAPGVLIQAEGRGYTNHYCRSHARTAADGTYVLELYPDQGYVVSVLDPDRTAPNITGVVIREGRPRSDLDFRLGPGTLMEGRVTAGPKAEPAAGETIYLKALGAPLPEELGKEVKGTRPELIRWAIIDSSGRYRLRVGPGEYQIAGPDMEFADLKIGPEATVYHDFQLRRLPRGPFEVVVHNPDGKPAAGAILLGGAIRDARTDGAGRCRGTRNRAPALVYAHDLTGAQAAIAIIGPDEDRADLTLRPAATATGRVVGADGRPRSDCTVTAIIRPTAGGTPEQWARLSTYSGFEGSVTLSGLADGVTCEIIVCSAMRCGVSPVKKFDVRGTSRIDLGDLRLPADEK